MRAPESLLSLALCFVLVAAGTWFTWRKRYAMIWTAESTVRDCFHTLDRRDAHPLTLGYILPGLRLLLVGLTWVRLHIAPPSSVTVGGG